MFRGMAAAAALALVLVACGGGDGADDESVGTAPVTTTDEPATTHEAEAEPGATAPPDTSASDPRATTPRRPGEVRLPPGSAPPDPTDPVVTDGLLVRLTLLGGHRSELLVPGYEISLDGTGRLVVVSQRSTEDRTLQLDAEGSEAVLDLVDRTLLGLDGPTPSVSVGEGMVARIQLPTTMDWFEERVEDTWDGLPAPPPAGTGPLTFADLAAALVDLSWLDEHATTAATGPEAISLRAQVGVTDYAGEVPPAVPWPLAQPIEQLAVGADEGPDGTPQVVLCLSGADAATVVALFDRPDTAPVTVDDGTAVWHITYEPVVPGYSAYGEVGC
jgi:hypothetical protein